MVSLQTPPLRDQELTKIVPKIWKKRQRAAGCTGISWRSGRIIEVRRGDDGEVVVAGQRRKLGNFPRQKLTQSAPCVRAV